MMQLIEMNQLDDATRFQNRLTLALKAARICVFEVDLLKQLYTFFQNSEDIFGVPGDVILRDVQQFSKLGADEYRRAASKYFAHPEDEEVIADAFCDILSGKPTTYEARMRAGGSCYTWCKIDAMPIMYQGKPVKMIGVITDISEQKRRNEGLKEKARLDNFTGLYHKQYAISMMEKALNQKDASYALALLDINKFKAYNDLYGHYEGDNVIKKLAESMQQVFRPEDILGRFGGDEFIVLIKDVTDEKVLCEMMQPITEFYNGDHRLTTSIGVAVYPKDATTFEELFKKADKALYDCKAVEDAIVFFS